MACAISFVRKRYTESGKKAAWRRDPLKPKKPLSPFFKYMEAFMFEA